MLDAPQQDRLLRFAALVRDEIDASGEQVALIARSGIDLRRFGIRFSHSGIALKSSDDARWSIRQLYYACDEALPRLYDQGMAGFLLGTDQPDLGHVSIVLLPAPQADRLHRDAIDRHRALRLLAARYSANAFPFSVRYQNCNQWVAEMLAAAWGGLPDGDDLRARAQQWLAGAGYAPASVDIGSHLLKFAGSLMPLMHFDDHPDDERQGLRMRVSLPASIEDFVRQSVPGARRIELCHDGQQMVVRHGWAPIPEGCRPERGDRVVPLR